MKVEKTRRAILGVLAISVVLFMYGAAWAQTSTNNYVFVPGQSTVVQTGGFAGIEETHTIEGQFQLTVDFDANIASFDQVDATLSESVYLPTQDLGELFQMTELVSTDVNETAIDFVDTNPPLGGIDINIRLTFMGNLVHLTGRRTVPWPDGFQYDLDAIAVPRPVTYYVDAADGNDNNDGLTPETAFATIQRGIDETLDGDTVLVYPGLYLDPNLLEDPYLLEKVNFLGKNITVTSTDPTNHDIVKNTVIRGTVLFNGTEEPNCTLTGFTIRDLYNGAIYGNHTHATISYCVLSGNGPCGAIVIKDCDGTISNCLITDNTTVYWCGLYPVVFGCHGLIRNCTIANNEFGVGVLDGGTTTIENCIIYNNAGSQLDVGSGGTVNISYCDVQDGLEGITGDGTVNWGPGNIDTDPCFVRLGYWEYEPQLFTLVEGDYHLLSERGRYWPQHGVWVLDEVTSPCIDGGNPTIDPSNEPMPNGARINMGAYGNTAYASMSEWPIKGDINRDGIVNMIDLAILAGDWLEKEEWFNLPPQVYITEPQDGAVIPFILDTLEIYANARDVDGSVVKVEFFANGRMLTDDDGVTEHYEGSDIWCFCWFTHQEGTSYSLMAKATDDDGATTTSPAVQIIVECSPEV